MIHCENFATLSKRWGQIVKKNEVWNKLSLYIEDVFMSGGCFIFIYRFVCKVITVLRWGPDIPSQSLAARRWLWCWFIFYPSTTEDTDSEIFYSYIKCHAAMGKVLQTN